MENIKQHVTEKFESAFGKKNEYVFTSGGRFEILGNHTDHNHGLCLAATCNLCITSAVSPRNDNTVIFYSEGYDKMEFSLDNLEHIHGENASSEMIKGVAKYFTNYGYKVGGFDCYSYSTIYSGAGVSSSAAFELLVAKIFNELYNNNEIPTIFMCKAGQYSENNYYEKKSGLLDQIGVGFGNIVSIDFKDIKNPVVNQIAFPFTDLHFVSVNTGGSHIGLNDLYSSIPSDMLNCAKKLGHEFLRECSVEDLENTKGLSTMEKNRALHFFGENDRVNAGIEALKNNDKQGFLDAINGSRISSTNLLQNMMVENQYTGSPLEACDRAMEIMKGKGACKINGGGFAGSIICVVPETYLETFLSEMSEHYGEENVKEVFVRPFGPIKE